MSSKPRQSIARSVPTIPDEWKTPETVEAILDAAKDLLVMVLDRDGRIVHFNRACQQVTGYTLDEARGRVLWDLLLTPGAVPATKAAFEETLRGTPHELETFWVTKEGRCSLVSCSYAPVHHGERVDLVVQTGFDVTARHEAKQKVQESEATIRAMLETASQAILAVDGSGDIKLANPAARQMYGYAPDEILGLPLENLIPKRNRMAYAAHLKNRLSQVPPQALNTLLEMNCLRKDGSEFPAEVSLSSISITEGTLGVAFVSDITERRKNEQKVLEYQEQLQKLTARLLDTQESGNRQVARELHDVFSQELVGLSMEIWSIKESVEAGEDLRERLVEIGRKVARLAVDIHRTSRNLHPAAVEELGLEPALRQECQTFEQRSGIPIELIVENVPDQLPVPVALCAYRVAQECLRNIHKHASDSERVCVSLQGTPGGVTLRVEDSGDGFELNTLNNGGLGLISMEERVRLLSGKLAVRSEPGKGTTLTAFIPLGGDSQDGN